MMIIIPRDDLFKAFVVSSLIPRLEKKSAKCQEKARKAQPFDSDVPRKENSNFMQSICSFELSMFQLLYDSSIRSRKMRMKMKKVENVLGNYLTPSMKLG